MRDKDAICKWPYNPGIKIITQEVCYMYQHQLQQQGAKQHECMGFVGVDLQKQKVDQLTPMKLHACYAPFSNPDSTKLVWQMWPAWWQNDVNMLIWESNEVK